MILKFLGSLKLGSLSLATSLLLLQPAAGQEMDVASGFFASWENVFLTPYLTSDMAVERNQSGITAVASDEQFQHEFAYSPRLSVGYACESGFGMRARFWKYDTGASELFTAGPNESLLGRYNLANSNSIAVSTGASILADESIKMQTFDAEVSQRLSFCRWEMNAGGGIRQANGAFGYSAQALTALGAPQNRREIDHRFDGVGPTLFGEFRRPLAETGFTLLGNGRYSVLFGEAKTSGFDVNSSGVLSSQYNYRNTSHLRIGEIQLGLEWACPIRCDGRFFVQALWEAQVWENLGYDVPINSSGQRSESFEDLGMLGAAFTIGVEL